MDYKQLWDRWVSLTLLTEEDRAEMIERLHEEVTSGITALATLGVAQMEKVLAEQAYGKKDEYLKAVAPVVALSALDGYFLSLMERGIHPQKADLAKQESTKAVGETWSRGHQKDQNKSYVEKIDPVVILMLERIYDLRVNQTLSFHPEIVELPYKVTEKLHQYIGWAVYQGYVIGEMENELSRP
ncbi:hypothetical protein KJZ67_02590 [Patescibacteria group bacterium]|nr:hypothetical protein [Patescibacteria group bacterium]